MVQEGEIIGRCPSCLSPGFGFGLGGTCRSSSSSPFALRCRPGGRLEASPSRFFVTPIVPSGPARFGVTSRPCGPLCNQACIAGLWPGSRSGATKPPWSIGFKMPRNRHPGRRRIALATRGPAFEGQPPNGGPSPVRDPPTSEGRRGEIQVVISADGLCALSSPRIDNPQQMVGQHDDLRRLVWVV